MGSLEHIERVTDLKPLLGDFPISHQYTSGVAGERFFREIVDNARLLGTHCGQCSFTYVPPSAFCPRCFASLEEWREVGPGGVVRARTDVHIDLDGHRLESPQSVGLIQLDGAEGLLAHRLTGDVQVGRRVEPVFKKPAKREGSIRDIEHFKPA
jgi:uncharacterized OB-fold protein